MSLLEPSLVGDIRSLSDELQTRLQRNYASLVRTINSKDGLTDELLAADCLTWRQKEYIEHPAITHSESKSRLIDIVTRGNETDFAKFIECLNKIDQRHVSRILIEDGAAAFIVATTSPENNREQQDMRIVDQLTALLRDTPDERREESRQCINQLRENDVTILRAEIGRRIGLYYFATSL